MSEMGKAYAEILMDNIDRAFERGRLTEQQRDDAIDEVIRDRCNGEHDREYQRPRGPDLSR